MLHRLLCRGVEWGLALGGGGWHHWSSVIVVAGDEVDLDAFMRHVQTRGLLCAATLRFGSFALSLPPLTTHVPPSLPCGTDLKCTPRGAVFALEVAALEVAALSGRGEDTHAPWGERCAPIQLLTD